MLSCSPKNMQVRNGQFTYHPTVIPPSPVTTRTEATLAIAITRAFDPGVPMYAVTYLVAFWSPIASVALTFAIAAFYLPSAALFDRFTD